jgi:hypothetical protein
MMSKSNPENSDAVLGGQNPPPVNAAILGGLAGAQQRLESESILAKLQALKDSIKYGTDGINLSLQALSDPNEDVKRVARRLLRSQAGEEGKAALLEREPLSFCPTLADWRWEIYTPEVGIIDPENNAYIVRLSISLNQNRQPIYDLSEFEALIEDPKIWELQALIFQVDSCMYSFGIALEAICDAKNLFPHLCGLFVGDSTNENPEYHQSSLGVFDIKPFLEAFPDLEVLQIHGHFAEYTLECAGIKHHKLKTLIIETADISEENLRQISAIEAPNLEYFELWLGIWRYCLSHSELEQFHKLPEYLHSNNQYRHADGRQNQFIYRYSVSSE